MARFVWRLERVLNAREKIEQATEAQLHGIAAEIRRLEGQMNDIRERLVQSAEGLGQMHGSERLMRQQIYLRHAQFSEQEIGQLAEKRSEAEKRRREKMEELSEIRRSIKVLEKLREKAKQEWMAEQDRIEQNETDDLNNIRSARLLADVHG